MVEDHYKGWFIGPKAENRDIFEELIKNSLEEHCFWRKNFHSEDAIQIHESDKDKLEKDKIYSELREKTAELNNLIKNSPSFFTPRYSGHMVTDPSLPAFIGHFIGMLYNNNNTTEEVSPATLAMEMEVMKDLVRMVDYPETSWGHLTTGGSMANFHCLWRARDLRLLPFVLACVYLKSKRPIKRVLEQIHLRGRGCIGDIIENNQLSLLSVDEALELLYRVQNIQSELPGISHELRNYSLYKLGIEGFASQCKKILRNRYPNRQKWIVNKAIHYSVNKSLNLLGVGDDDMIVTDLSESWAMETPVLDAELDRIYSQNDFPVALVSIFGTTEVGAGDPTGEIYQMRTRRHKEGRGSFWYHVDCAWGGYYLVLRHPATRELAESIMELFKEIDHADLKGVAGKEKDRYQLYQRWTDQFVRDTAGIRFADSITLDPHKTGYVPYSCGACLFKEYIVRETANYTFAPINAFSRGDNTDKLIWDVPRMAYYTIEGSRASTGATSAWLAHKTVSLDRDGFGVILGRSIMSALLFQQEVAGKEFSLGGNCKIKYVFVSDLPMTGITCYTFEIEYYGRILSLKFLNKVLFEIYQNNVLHPKTHLHTKSFFFTMTFLKASAYHTELSALLKKTNVTGKLYRSGDESEAINPWLDDDHVVLLRNTIFNPFFLSHDSPSHDGSIPIVKEYCDFLNEQIYKAVEKVCNAKLAHAVPVKFPGNVLVLESNPDFRQLIIDEIKDNFQIKKGQLLTASSYEEAEKIYKKQIVHAVITGWDPSQKETDGYKLLKVLSKCDKCYGAIIFTMATIDDIAPCIKELQTLNPSWKLIYLPHFSLHSFEVQITMNELSEKLWEIFNTHSG